MILLGSCAGWSLITAAARDGRPEGMLLAVLAVAAGYASGRISGALLPVAAPCAGAVAGLALAVAEPGLSPGLRYAAPLGQADATAALLTLATGAACCAAWATPVPALRLAMRVLAAGIALTGAVMGSTAGCAASAVVLLCSLAAGAMPHRGAGVAGLALAAALMAGAIWAVAADALPGGLADALDSRFTGHRVQLWHEALRLADRDTALGAGPGRFGELSPTAQQSLTPDGRPHSAPLQQAAEQGLVGVLLLAAAFGWMLYALWRGPRSTPVVLSAGTALTALAALAAVGNALSFPTVTAGAGLLAGWATARSWAGEGVEQPL
ncbi:O-antigen ligase [Streptomyces sp. NK08204]|uniref:O-antigen ligase family protein n=1 Tax=Streptomyces sp. NK08204 TaxID=2873260 RepID=UPI001CEC0708|nr:O-antigen ligase family protein [Streptomyces sp. NK08204]